MRIHRRVTKERVVEAVEEAQFGLGNPGFCIRCGADADGVEPDAEGYVCEECGEPAVFGAEQLLFYIS